MRVVVLFVGPAGSGKSSIVASYSKWLRENGYLAAAVNLDPAAEYIPYQPDFDIRGLVDARRIALERGLGPNGALVEAMEEIARRIDDIARRIAGLEAEYVLIDTPGQMEVFLFRDASWRLVDALEDIGSEAYAIFVVDATIIRRASDYAFVSLLSTATQLRLGIDTAPVLNKVDAAPSPDLRGDFIRDYGKIARQLRREHSLYAEMLRDLARVLFKYTRGVEVPKISAIRGEGLDELHRLIHEMSCNCGDLT